VISEPWDYLVVTASHEDQASAYRSQLDIRQKLGLIPGTRNVLVVPDPGGRRVGSGGSTIHSLLQVISRELVGSREPLEREAWLACLRNLRILIVHAGGDSRRIPAYGPCGKIFIPVPGETDRALGMTLLDRQLPVYLGLPPSGPGRGQVVIASGDVLLSFDSASARFADGGITGLGCTAAPELASRHGVYCPAGEGRVRRFLQKPSPAEQAAKGAVHRHGQSILDIGVMGFDAATAVAIISVCDIARQPGGGLAWTGPMGEAIETNGLDFYREIACALGTEAEAGDYVAAARAAGSTLDDTHLFRIFQSVSGIPFHVSILPQCGFLHFGTSRQLIQSGSDILSIDDGTSHAGDCLSVNNAVRGEGRIAGLRSWVEGCRLEAPLALGGENAVIGVDIRQPLALPAGAVLDVLEGRDRAGRRVRFVRCYGIDDVFHRPAPEASLAGLPLADWLRAMDAGEGDIWSDDIPAGRRLVWNARVFPAVPAEDGYRDWLWMLSPERASRRQRADWRAADRYSFAEVAGLASQEEFHRRRFENRSEELRRDLRQVFRPGSGFSAAELAFILAHAEREALRNWVTAILRQCCAHAVGGPAVSGLERLEPSRILHTLGSALQSTGWDREAGAGDVLAGAFDGLTKNETVCLSALGLTRDMACSPSAFAVALQDLAFENVGRTIVMSREKHTDFPKNALREDEIVWGRAPARLDLGGGWSDTPPYSLEHGGCVINAAVDLNGQPPIHAYARVIPEPEIRIASIDHGVHVVIRELDDLMDYRSPESKFGLAKAALALCGFSRDSEGWPGGARTLGDRLRLFGGGIELTTLAAIPSGSGLGTSSIMGAVLTAVVRRMTGRPFEARELFHDVLRLEQELTTGGGWQDQVGGVLPGVKMITTAPGLVPDPRIHYVPADVLDPRVNGGQALLYYTGMRRLAKNILHDVVGGYLDRDRGSMDTLKRIHAFPPSMVEAMAAKDAARFGRLLNEAWNLKKRIDPESTTEVIEKILRQAAPMLLGAKLMGAGGGGFLLLFCRSGDSAKALRAELDAHPPNDRARFFEFAVSADGLAVTVC
jgi:galactokinase/mevalonate kinase-like predicted kinase